MQLQVVMRGLDPRIHVIAGVAGARRKDVDCMEVVPDMGDAGGHSDRGLVSSTVAISEPPASRSNTRTVDWACTRIQSGVPTKPRDLSS